MKRWTNAVLMIALVAAFWWGYWERSSRLQLVYALEASYQRAFYDTLAQVEIAENTLAKSMAAGTPQRQAQYLTEVWSRAMGAQATLAQLPFKDIDMSVSRKFLAQLGDYSHILSMKLDRQENLSQEELNRLAQLRKNLSDYGQELHNIEVRQARGGFRWSSEWQKPMGRQAVAAGGRFQEFVDIDQRLQELPGLTYDGPFSDHLELRKPYGLSGSTVTQQEARERAEEFIRLATGQNYQIVSTGESNGMIETFRFNLKAPQAAQVIDIDISKTGAHPVWMLSDRNDGTVKLSVAEARKKAESFVERAGFGPMRATGSIRSGIQEVVALVPVVEDTLLYPDLVKVTIAMDDGTVIGWEAMAFLMAHRQRQLPEPKLTQEAVRQQVNSSLEINKISRALIPLDSGKEILTYEVQAQNSEDKFYIYVNALNGAEELIFRVLELPEGQALM